MGGVLETRAHAFRLFNWPVICASRLCAFGHAGKSSAPDKAVNPVGSWPYATSNSGKRAEDETRHDCLEAVVQKEGR